MTLDSETQRQNLLRLLDRVQMTGAEAVVELKAATRPSSLLLQTACHRVRAGMDPVRGIRLP